MLYTTLSTAGIAIEENLVRICLVLFFFLIFSKTKRTRKTGGEHVFIWKNKDNIENTKFK